MSFAYFVQKLHVVIVKRNKMYQFLACVRILPVTSCHRIDYGDDSPETQSRDVDEDSEQTLDC